MICGHDRETLRWALRYARDERRIEMFVQYPPWGDCLRAEYLAARDIIDSAKLAAIIAELLRERGFVDLSDDDFAPKNEARVRAQGEQIMIVHRLVGSHKIGGPLLATSQARKFALALLESPNASAQDVERMIGEVTK